MSSQGSGGEGAKGTPLAGEGSASEPPGRQKTQRMEPPRAEEGDLMPRSPHLADPAPAHCRRRTDTRGTRFCDAAGLPPAPRPPGSQVLSDAAIPGTVVLTLVSSSSCLFSSSSCWVRACLPLVSCETSTSFSSTWWLSSPNARTWPRSALRLPPPWPAAPQRPTRPHRSGSAVSPSACSDRGLTVSAGRPWL